VEANEPSLYLRREKLALQYALKLKSNLSNPTYKCVFHPQSQDLFLAKPSVIPPFSIHYRQAIEELNIDLGQIAKLEFTRTPPWTYESVFVDWCMSYNCKTDTTPTVFRAEYLRIKSEYEHHVYIYI
jgi:hypothetical protein